MARLSSPRGLPSVLAGFLNLGQQPIPIIWLHRLLDLPESGHGLYTQILILREGSGRSVGWIVDRVTQIVSTKQTEILAVPENQCFKDCAEGTFSLNGENVTILSSNRVLLEKERQSIREFEEIERARLCALEVPAS